MNTVNDSVQKLFTEYENKAHDKQKLFSEFEDQDRDKHCNDILSEIRTLRHAWDELGWNWEEHDLGRDLERSYYRKAWEQIQNKLAMRIERISKDDYWWRPPQYQETVSLLWEITGTLRRAASPRWRQSSAVAWHVFKELLYLGIVAALLLSSRNNFETRVIALLVLIYNAIVQEVGSLGLALNSIQVIMGDELRNVARSMKLKTSVMDFVSSERFGMGSLLTSISGISCMVGNVIALAALITSLF